MCSSTSSRESGMAAATNGREVGGDQPVLVAPQHQRRRADRAHRGPGRTRPAGTATATSPRVERSIAWSTHGMVGARARLGDHLVAALLRAAATGRRSTARSCPCTRVSTGDRGRAGAAPTSPSTGTTSSAMRRSLFSACARTLQVRHGGRDQRERADQVRARGAATRSARSRRPSSCRPDAPARARTARGRR